MNIRFLSVVQAEHVLKIRQTELPNLCQSENKMTEKVGAWFLLQFEVMDLRYQSGPVFPTALLNLIGT